MVLYGSDRTVVPVPKRPAMRNLCSRVEISRGWIQIFFEPTLALTVSHPHEASQAVYEAARLAGAHGLERST
jgi:hypothetical protein